MNPGILHSAITDIAEEGYGWVSFSGGEPTVYPDLADTLAHAKQCGLNNIVVSNGLLLNDKRLDALAPNLDLLVLSLDGTPESHNRLRNHPRAFELLLERLEPIRQRNLPFGFIFTLTQYNLDELLWVVDFAAQQGAGLVQIHPLENVGEASTHLADSVPDALEQAYAFAIKQEIQKRMGGALALQLDLIHSEILKQCPDRFYANLAGNAVHRALSDILTPLVIETDGTVVPMQYGFDRRYALGNLRDERLRVLGKRWKSTGLPAFEHLCRHTFRLATEGEPGFRNWYELLGKAAAEAAVPEEEDACV